MYNRSKDKTHIGYSLNDDLKREEKKGHHSAKTNKVFPFKSKPIIVENPNYDVMANPQGLHSALKLEGYSEDTASYIYELLSNEDSTPVSETRSTRRDFSGPESFVLESHV